MSAYADAVAADGDGCVIALRVLPRARRHEIAGLHGAAVRVRVASPPADGRANAEVLALLAAVLGVPRRDLTLVAGQRGRDKRVRVAGVTAEAAARLLREAATGA